MESNRGASRSIDVDAPLLLALVGRSHALLAELQRVASAVPPLFMASTAQLPDLSAYTSRRLADYPLLDVPHLKNRYAILAQRFVAVLQGIHRYAIDLSQQLAMIRRAALPRFVQEHAAILAEALAMNALLSILLEHLLPAQTRERLLVAHLKWSRTSLDVVALSKLVKSQCSPQRKGHRLWPSASAFPIDSEVIALLLSKLRSCDIYSQLAPGGWPSPRHRDAALAPQGALALMLLYLNRDTNVSGSKSKFEHISPSLLRALIDHHFHDTIVVPIYMGFTVDLTQMGLVTIDCARHQLKKCAEDYSERVRQLLPRLERLLEDGGDDVDIVFDVIRESNATLRWVLLHRTCENKKLRQFVCDKLPDPSQLLQLAMLTSQLEYQFRAILQQSIATRRQRFDTLREECIGRLEELSDHFSGDESDSRCDVDGESTISSFGSFSKGLLRRLPPRDEQLKNWFYDLSLRVAKLNIDNNDDNERIDDSAQYGGSHQLRQIIRALEDVERFKQVNASLVVLQFLDETRCQLRMLDKFFWLRDDLLATFNMLTDFSYAWGVFRNDVDERNETSEFVLLMQDRLKHDPSSSLLLRSLFLKLASVLDMALVRINQTNSGDCESVAAFYSSQLVTFIRDVLQIIPHKLLQLTFDTSMKASQIEWARSIHTIALLSRGIKAMEKTLVGIVSMDPSQLFIDGFKLELCRRIAQQIDRSLFTCRRDAVDFETQIQTLGKVHALQQSALVRVQDFVGIHALKLWNEQIRLLFDAAIAVEVGNDGYDPAAIASSHVIVHDMQIDGSSTSKMGQTFLGRLTHLLVEREWRQCNNDNAQLRSRMAIRLLSEAFGSYGVWAVGEMLSHAAAHTIHEWATLYRSVVNASAAEYLNVFYQALSPTCALPPRANTFYSDAIDRCSSLWRGEMTNLIRRLGHLNHVRLALTAELRSLSSIQAPLLAEAARSLDESLVLDGKCMNSLDTIHELEGNLETNTILRRVGLTSPLNKIYIGDPQLSCIEPLLLLFTIEHINDAQSQIERSALVAGMASLLQQLSRHNVDRYLELCGQYVRAIINLANRRHPATHSYSAKTMLLFLEELSLSTMLLPRERIESHLSPSLWAIAQSLP